MVICLLLPNRGRHIIARVWPVGGVWSTRSAGAIGSGCRQVSAIRPNQEVCIYVPALPFSRDDQRERETLPWTERRGGKSPENATVIVDPTVHVTCSPCFTCCSLLSNKSEPCVRVTPSLCPPTL